MQHVSKAYKESMKKTWRNIGYIKVYIGIVNAEVQKRATAQDERNTFTYFSFHESKRRDLNTRPLRPERSAAGFMLACRRSCLGK